MIWIRIKVFISNIKVIPPSMYRHFIEKKKLSSITYALPQVYSPFQKMVNRKPDVYNNNLIAIVIGTLYLRTDIVLWISSYVQKSIQWCYSINALLITKNNFQRYQSAPFVSSCRSQILKEKKTTSKYLSKFFSYECRICGEIKFNFACRII